MNTPRTLVVFHAHPDDESIATGGTMAKAAAEGHRVVLVLATKGEHGEVDDGFLDAGEDLGERRVKETLASADLLGVSRVEFLGYVDSGMMGTPENDAPDSFWQTDVEKAAQQLAAILKEERADILTAYDENGVYGHPDHIQVHRVGMRAAELAGTPRVYLSTIDKARINELIRAAQESGTEIPGDTDTVFDIGVDGALVTTKVDVRPFIEVKRASMAAHASQISETSFFLSMPRPDFDAGFGQEDYILYGASPGTHETDLFEALP